MTVRLGCGIDGMRNLPARSVQLVLSDLPSGETRASFDKPVDLSAFWRSVDHALDPSGCVVLMASSLRFAAELQASRRRWFRFDLVWSKSIATGFLNAGHRPLRAHEFVLVFSPGRHAYNPQFSEGHKPIHGNTFSDRNHGGSNYGRSGSHLSRKGETNRYPRSVLQVPSLACNAKARRHPQQKPDELMRHLVRSYSNAGDLVCDPCAGSGSTGAAAKVEARRFIGWDSDPRFGTAPMEVA